MLGLGTGKGGGGENDGRMEERRDESRLLDNRGGRERRGRRGRGGGGEGVGRGRGGGGSNKRWSSDKHREWKIKYESGDGSLPAHLVCIKG